MFQIQAATSHYLISSDSVTLWLRNMQQKESLTVRFPVELLMSEERAKEIEAMSDEDIDYSDIPPLDEDFFKNAKRVLRKARTEQISIRIETEVLEWFRTHAKGKGYQTLINDVLRTYVKYNS